MSLFRIQSVQPACASLDEDNIIVSDCDDAAASGFRLDTIDDQGNTQYYFINGSRVWLVGCPEVLDDIIGLPIEINRPFWADIILDAVDLFAE